MSAPRLQGQDWHGTSISLIMPLALGLRVWAAFFPNCLEFKNAARSLKFHSCKSKPGRF